MRWLMWKLGLRDYVWRKLEHYYVLTLVTYSYSTGELHFIVDGRANPPSAFRHKDYIKYTGMFSRPKCDPEFVATLADVPIENRVKKELMQK